MKNNYKLQRKLLNVYIFIYLLFKLNKKYPKNYDAMIKLQNKRIKKLMKCAYEIPFYKKRFDEAGVTPDDINCAEDLAKLPILTKDELREWMAQESEKEEYKYWFKDTTSGSTGQPLVHLYSPKEKAYNSANWYRVLMLCGYNPFFGKTMSPVMAHSISGENTSFVQKLGILRRKFVYQYCSEQEVIDNINEYKPDMLYLNKSIFMRLALYSKNNNIPVYKPKFYCPTGEMIDDNTRKILDDVFKGEYGMINSYGTSETGSMAVKSYDSDIFLVNHDLFVINVYDENNRLADEGKAIVTPLYLTDLPLINYVIGDKVETVGYKGVKHIKNVCGRMNDFIKYEDGQVTTFFEIAPIIAQTKGIAQIRFVQKSYDDILIKCAIDKANTDLTKEQIEERLRTLLGEKFKKEFNLTFEWLDSIPPDKNGKLRMIVCEID